MNDRKIKEARKEVNEAMKTFDDEARAKMRVPLLRRLCTLVGYRRPEAKWRAWWERRHAWAMQIARKKVAHVVATRKAGEE